VARAEGEELFLLSASMDKTMQVCVAVCCSVLKCVAVGCRMLQYVAVCYSVL